MEQTEPVLAALDHAPDIIVPLVREMPPARVKRRPRPGKWSVHEHACHLAAVHPMFFDRLERMLAEDHPRITPYFPDTDDEDGSLLRVDLDEALARFAADRRRLVARLRGLGPADWARTAAHAEYSRYSVFILFRHVAMHDLLHAYRIEELVLSP